VERFPGNLRLRSWEGAFRLFLSFAVTERPFCTIFCGAVGWTPGSECQAAPVRAVGEGDRDIGAAAEGVQAPGEGIPMGLTEGRKT